MKQKLLALGLVLLLALTAGCGESSAPQATLTSVQPVVQDMELTDYILNTNTYKFHKPGCSSVDQMKESNKQAYTGLREDVIAMGYSPCGRCKP